MFVLSICALLLPEIIHCELYETLEGTPCPISLIESDIKKKLANECSSSTQKPNRTLIKWLYPYEMMRFSCPFSNIQQKVSQKIMSWKQHQLNASHNNGYNDSNPYIAQQVFFQDNLNDHMSLNGVSKCRDVDIVFHIDADHIGNSMCLQFKQTEILEIIRVGRHFRIPALSQQFAIRATRSIPIHTILGRFCGDEMFSFEYTELYQDTCEYTMRNHYRMSMECPNDTFSDIQCPFSGRDNQIVLDELDPFPANPMVIMNDVRKDISNKDLTEDDRRYWNAEFHHVHVNGWSLLYVVSTQPIFVGQEIAVYYGPNYVL